MNHPPLKEGATIHHLPVVRCALPGAACGKRMILLRTNHHRGRYTSPALSTASYPLCRFDGNKYFAFPIVFTKHVKMTSHARTLFPMEFVRDII